MVLQRLSLRVQSIKSSVSDIHSSLVLTVQELTCYRAKAGIKLAAIADLSNADVFMGQTLAERFGQGSDSFEGNRMKLLDDLLKYLEKWFADTKQSVIQATTITILKTRPPCGSDGFKDFGNADIQELCEHYDAIFSQAGVDLDVVGVEPA